MLSIVFAGVPMAAAKAPTQNGVLDIVWNGDYTVAGIETYTNEVIWVTGNITVPVGASLNLVNTTIVRNGFNTAQAIPMAVCL